MTRARALLASAVVLLAGCSSETDPLTEIVVVVDSDFSGLTRFEAEIEGFEEPSTVSADLDDEPLPRRFSLVHDGGPLGPIAVTVRAYVEGDAEPILVEPRTGMFFKAGQTLLLEIDLLGACVGLCEQGQACIAPGECVSSDDAAVLTPWRGQPDGLDVGGPLDAGMDSSVIDMPDGSMNEAGMTEDAGPDATPPEDSGPGEDADVEPDAAEPMDAEVDAGEDAIVPEPIWPYVPSNVELDDGTLAAVPRSVLLVDCPLATIDSTTPEASSFCHDAPGMVVLAQPGGGEALVVALSQLQVDAGTTLKLVGSRPVILLVEGDASVAGSIDASAQGATGGPGADLDCIGSIGGTGSDAPTTSNGAYGASGGSGGGFGSAGSASGASGNVAAIAGGAIGGEATLVPLRGGCRGGAGGLGENVLVNASPGGGGGALQLSVAGNLAVTGALSAAGGGGAVGQGYQGGGGGGGSGGAILIEAATYAIDVNAIFAVNGGAGGGGQLTSGTQASTPGGDGTASTTPSTAGFGAGSGGDGGRGAALAAPATSGSPSTSTGAGCPTTIACNWGGGGGGAGGVGRMHFRGSGTCAPAGTYSPAPFVTCESCANACPAQPDLSCVARAASARLYSVCTSSVTSSAARTLCQSSGLDLVKIVDASEQAFLAGVTGGTGYWIGAGDVVEDDWRWVVDNSQFWSGDETGAAVGGAFTAWRSGEPSGTGDCARVRDDGWSDEDCNGTSPFICEQP